MKWTGMKNGGGERSKILPLSLDREAMAVLSQQVCTTLSVPACIRAALVPTFEQERIRLTLRGGLVLGGLGVELIFRGASRSATGVSKDMMAKATLLPAGKAMDVDERSRKARAGTDPAAWVQVRDGDGVALTDQLYIGRLGKGPCLMDPAFSCPVTADTYISPFSISEPADSDLTLTGEMTFDHGLSLRVTLRRREGALWWGRRPDAAFDFEIVPPGTMVHFPAQPIWTGDVGSLRSLIFLDGDGAPLGSEHPVNPTVALH
jgi:hypothetical protein